MSNLKMISKLEFEQIISLHFKWLNGDKESIRADLRYTYLLGMNLNNLNLSYANLSYSDLIFANLINSNLSHSDLSYTNLKTFC